MHCYLSGSQSHLLTSVSLLQSSAGARAWRRSWEESMYHSHDLKTFNMKKKPKTTTTKAYLRQNPLPGTTPLPRLSDLVSFFVLATTELKAKAWLISSTERNGLHEMSLMKDSCPQL